MKIRISLIFTVILAIIISGCGEEQVILEPTNNNTIKIAAFKAHFLQDLVSIPSD